MTTADGTRLLGHLSVFFVLSALIAGFVGGKVGRRKTISAGILTLGGLFLALYLIPPASLTPILTKLPVLGNIPVISLFLMGAGVAWAFININSLPMVVDLVDDSRIGTYTGLYYLFSTMAAIFGPNVNGWIIQAMGENYNSIMIVAPTFMLFAFIMMLGVKRGEAKIEI
ncbi:MAG: MFS transporter [Anaerolineae bacterium]|nr:MFS transporter [Anaerolineae bacterium]